MQSKVTFDDQLQALLAYAKSTFGLNESEYTMVIADQPNTPPIVMQAQANQHTTTSQREHILGICQIVKVGPYGSGQGDASPVVNANAYFNVPNAKIDYATAKISILQKPKHGRLEPTNSDGDWRDTRYVPNEDYLGNDSFGLQVEGNGQKVNLRYFMYVTDGAGESMFENKACKGVTWKISQITPDTLIGNLATWQRASDLSTLLANASQSLTGS